MIDSCWHEYPYGLFLATLELVRLRRVTVLQDDIENDVELVLANEEEGLRDEGIEGEGVETQGASLRTVTRTLRCASSAAAPASPA